MKVLEDRSFADFIRRLKALLSQEFPHAVSLYTEFELNELILYCVDRAKIHEFETEEDIYHYVTGGVVFGRSFDVEEKTKWLQQSLNINAHVNNQRTAYFRAMDIYIAALETLGPASNDGR